MDFFEDFLVACFLVLIVFFLIFGAAVIFEEKACNTYSEVTERNIKWELFGGCFVEHGDQYIPKDEYKYVEIKK